jgi:hypothetical protein
MTLPSPGYLVKNITKISQQINKDNAIVAPETLLRISSELATGQKSQPVRLSTASLERKSHCKELKHCLLSSHA